MEIEDVAKPAGFEADPSDAVRRRRVDWRFILLWAIYGFAIIEAFYFAFRPGGLLSFGYGFDQQTYFAAARDWMAGNGYYESYQLAGPYTIDAREILYPPSLLVILVPFTYVPDILWILVPAVGTAVLVRSWRPTYWWLIAIGLCLAAPSSSGLYLLGSPTVWAVLFVAMATRWGWAGPLIMIKPSLFPFALTGIWMRSWWVSAAICSVLVLLTLPMWLDYVAVLLNARGPNANVLYGLWTVPMMFVPILAWAGRSRNPSAINSDVVGGEVSSVTEPGGRTA